MCRALLKAKRNRAAFAARFSVFVADLLRIDQREGRQLIFYHIRFLQANSGDVAVFVGGVIVDTLIRVAAAGVKGLFKGSVYPYTAILLGNGA